MNEEFNTCQCCSDNEWCIANKLCGNNISTEDLETKEAEGEVEWSMNLISDFIGHVKERSGFEIPEQYVLSFFNA
jgi:hypothetical protein